MIRTKKGDIVGVTGSKAPHVLTQEERGKVVDIKDMYIDVGVTGKFNVERRLGVRPGDPIVPISPFTIMGNKKAYLAKAWDDRVGCAMIIDVMEKLKRAKHNNVVFGVGTVQEEVGLRGARTSASVVDPDVAFALEVSIAHDTPGMDGTGEKLGNGPSILVYDGSMIPNFRLRDHVIKVAESKKIPHHLCALERGGTDSGIIHLNKQGVPSLVIGIPSRYIHGHVSIIDRTDYNNGVKLLIEVIKTLDEKTVRSLTA
jgi:endoglucanase